MAAHRNLHLFLLRIQFGSDLGVFGEGIFVGVLCVCFFLRKHYAKGFTF